MSISRALRTEQHTSIADDDRPLISRRALVRTGVTAAWSVPLIQVVGAAPALAVSGSKVEVIGGSAVWDGNYIDVTVPVQVTGTQTVDALTVTLIFSKPLAPEVNSGPNGRWSASRSVGGNQVTITYTTTRANLAPGSTTPLFIQVKDKDHKDAAGTVDVAVVGPTGSFGTRYVIAQDTDGHGGKG
jgi:hypothetical protein